MVSTHVLVPIQQIPWHTVRRVHRAIRTTAFRVPRPDHDVLAVDYSPEAIDRVLCSAPYHMEPGHWLSYEYQGEDLNLRRPVRRSDPAFPALTYWQLHVRGFERPDGRLGLDAHLEPSPQEHPKAHIQSWGLSVKHGRSRLLTILDDADIECKRVPPYL